LVNLCGFFLCGDCSRGDRQPRLVDGVQVIGPFNSPGVSETPSRQRVFICKPVDTKDTKNTDTQTKATKEGACARRIADSLARRAFRRPVTKDDIDSLMPYYEQG